MLGEPWLFGNVLLVDFVFLVMSGGVVLRLLYVIRGTVGGVC